MWWFIFVWVGINARIFKCLQGPQGPPGLPGQVVSKWTHQTTYITENSYYDKCSITSFPLQPVGKIAKQCVVEGLSNKWQEHLTLDLKNNIVVSQCRQNCFYEVWERLKLNPKFTLSDGHAWSQSGIWCSCRHNPKMIPWSMYCMNEYGILR